MKNILAPVVETVLDYNSNIEYCDLLYNSNDYTILFLALLLVPFIVMIAFYKLIDPILAKRVHWFTALFTAMGLVLVASFFVIMNGSMQPCYASPGFCNMEDIPNYENLITSLTMGIISAIPAIFYTWVLRLISVNNKTNPF